MTDSIFVDLTVPAGVDKTRSPEGAAGRWFDTQNIRFVNGKPEKKAGFTQLNTILLNGIARGFAAWNDPTTGAPLYAVGTTTRLYGSTDGTEPIDITPLVIDATLVDQVTTATGSGFVRVAGIRRRINIPFTGVALSTTNGSAIVVVNFNQGAFYDSALGIDLATGDTISLPDSISVGGLALQGDYVITGRRLVGSISAYEITAASAATATATTSTASSTTALSASLAWYYLPAISFSKTNFTDIVTCTTAADHGLAVGQAVNFLGSSSVTGGTITGVYPVYATPSATTFQIRVSFIGASIFSTAMTGGCAFATVPVGRAVKLFQPPDSDVGGLSLRGEWLIVSQDDEQTHVLVPRETEAALANNPVTVAGSSRFVTSLQTTSTSPTVTVNETATPVVVGDHVVFPGSTSIGGISFGGEYIVVTKATNSFTVTHTSNATSTATSGSGISYWRKIAAALGVTIAWTGHGLSVGAHFAVTGMAAVSGILMQGEYEVATVPGANSITVTLLDPQFAESSAAGGGAGIMVYTEGAVASETIIDGGGSIPLVVSTSNPLSVVDGSASITVTLAGHGRSPGEFVLVEGASAIGGITPNGFFVIDTVPDDDTLTYTFTSPATSTVSNGGGAPYVEFPIGAGHADALDGSYDADFWSITPVGSTAIMARTGGPAYFWDGTASRAQVMGGPPDIVTFVCQTEERITHYLGAYGEPLRFVWSDRDDPRDIVATETNEAGDRRVQFGSKLVAMTPFGNGLNLIWTDTTCYTHQFTGSAFIYDTHVAVNGNNAGLVGPHAFAVTPQGVFWMSPNGLKAWSGAVLDIPNNEDVRDWLFRRLNVEQQGKCHAIYDPVNEAIDFYYPATTDEPESCVTVCLKDFSWANDESYARVAGAVFNKGRRNPYKITIDGRIMEHEVGVDWNGEASTDSIASAPILPSKTTWSEILGFDPDFKRQTGTVHLAVSGYDRAAANVVDTDSVDLSEGIEMGDLRMAARHLAFTLSQTEVVGGDWAIDTPKIEVKMAGSRR